MDYRRRLAALREAMYDKDLSAVLLATDASLEYFTGVPRQASFATKSRQNSQEFSCLLVDAGGATLFLPRLSGLGLKDRTADFPALDRLILFPDDDLSGRTFRRETRSAVRAGARVGITRDTSALLVMYLVELGAVPVDVSPAVDRLRAVKDDDELALMREAAAIADRLCADFLPALKIGSSVRSLELDVERALEAYGASAPSFPAELIVHGPKAGVGYGTGVRSIEAGHTLAWDFGVVYKGYCSDFGRTYFLETPDSELREIFDVVMDAAAAGRAALAAGRVTGEDAHLATRRVIEAAGYGDYFCHRTGHGIGKDVHERPFLADGEKTVLEENMCFTVEPSIYIPRRCLIRVEDVVVVGRDGGRPLTETPRTCAVVGEEWR